MTNKKTDEISADDTYEDETPAPPSRPASSKLDLNEPENIEEEIEEPQAEEMLLEEEPAPAEEPFEEVKTRKRKPRKE
jgi:hypothetical protein